MASVVAVGGKRLELACPVAGYPIEGITWEKGRATIITVILVCRVAATKLLD